MNRSDLINALIERAQLPRRQAETVVVTVFDCIADALDREERTEIRGFGSFSTRSYPPYTGRNPKTGEPIEVAAKRLPYFKVGRELRMRVDQIAEAEEE